MTGSESGEVSDGSLNGKEVKQMKSVVQAIGKEDQYMVLSRLSDEDSDDKENDSERNWRRRKDNSQKEAKLSNYDNEHSISRQSNRHQPKKHRPYVDLDRPVSDENDPDEPEYRSRRRERRERHDERRSNKRRKSKEREERDQDNVEDKKEDEKAPEAKKKKTIEDIFTKAGGAYIPPSKLRQLQAGITDKNSVAYQRMAWEALKKSINGLVNKVNVSNIEFVVSELLQENVVRGRGLLSQSIIRAQVASPTYSNVYASLVAIINTKFPKVGELILRRLIIQFRRSFKRNDKRVCINSAKFIAHLANQEVAHELLALELLTLLLQNPTGDSAEVAISFLKDIGQKLTEVSPRGINAVFERLRNILHDSETEKRVQYMIEVMFAVRKDGFKDYPIVSEGLDKVEEDDQITHLLRLDDAASAEDILNVFKHDPDFEENEEKYKQIKQSILGDDDDSDDDSEGEDGSGEEESDEDEDGDNKKEGSTMEIIDKTETNLVALRRLIYLTVQSSLDFEECAHKMMKIQLKPGQEHEFCLMVVECCTQQRSFEKFFGLLGQRFCLLRKEFMEQYVIIFKEQYDACHHLETNKLRNTSKFFSHLLYSDAIPWTVMENVRLNEDDTTSSSRIFIKIMFQELAEYLGLQKFKTRLKDPIIAPYLEGVFPRDNPRDTRFAINFFTAIGLGGLTDELREHLKTMPKVTLLAQQLAAAADENQSSGSSSSDDSDSSSSSGSSSDDSSSDDGNKKSNKKKTSTVEERLKRIANPSGYDEGSKEKQSHGEPRKKNKNPMPNKNQKRNQSQSPDVPRRRNRNLSASPEAPRRRNRSPSADNIQRNQKKSPDVPRRRNRSPSASPEAPRRSNTSPSFENNQRNRNKSPKNVPRRKNRSPYASPEAPRRRNRSPSVDNNQRNRQKSPNVSHRRNRSPSTSPPRRINHSPYAKDFNQKNRNQSPNVSHKRNRSLSTSPPRRRNRSPNAKDNQRIQSPHAASHRRNQNRSVSPDVARRRHHSPSTSPPRRRNQNNAAEDHQRKQSQSPGVPRRRHHSPSTSPPRRRNRNTSVEDHQRKQSQSPDVPRRRHHSPSTSPPRRRNRNTSVEDHQRKQSKSPDVPRRRNQRDSSDDYHRRSHSASPENIKIRSVINKTRDSRYNEISSKKRDEDSENFSRSKNDSRSSRRS